MNLPEFKAWFEGFTESMDGPPGEKAWKRIRDRIGSINSDEPTTRHVFHEYYARPWQRWYNDGPWWGVPYSGGQGIGVAAVQGIVPMSSMGASIANAEGAMQAQNGVNSAMGYQPVPSDEGTTMFDAQSAFNKLGRAEALSLTHTKMKA